MAHTPIFVVAVSVIVYVSNVVVCSVETNGKNMNMKYEYSIRTDMHFQYIIIYLLFKVGSDSHFYL